MHQTLQIKEYLYHVKSIEEEVSDESQPILGSLRQKFHNDQHIFYSLKTSPFQTGNSSIFSIPMKSAQTKQSRHDIRIKSRRNLRNSLNIKTSIPQNPLQPKIQYQKINSPFKSTPSIQRAHKKVQIKNTQIPEIKFDLPVPKNKIKWTNNSFDESFKMKTKNSQKRRNYFNVKQLMQIETQNKKDSPIIMFKNTPNGLMNRKKQHILGKVELPLQKVKQFQFNAIKITKNIVEKSYGKFGNINRIRGQDKKQLFQSNNQQNQWLNGHKKQLVSSPGRSHLYQKLMDGIFEQRGSLWRSNSYQLPRSKQMLPSNMNRTASIRNEKSNENCGRSVQYDQNIDLDPWSMGYELNLSSIKTRYAAYKTQNKHQDQENEFLNYYIKTSAHQK